MSTGCIIAGYQGVGKTTLTGIGKRRFIDLESSNFWIEEKTNRAKNWAYTYAKIAKSLAKQGFYVLVSTHVDLLDELEKIEDVPLFLLYPGTNLCNKWLDRLEERYNQSVKKNIEEYSDDSRKELEKNTRAFANAVWGYDDSISGLSNRNPLVFQHLVIVDLEEYVLDKSFINTLKTRITIWEGTNVY